MQPELQLSARGLARNYRIGPALQSYESANFKHFIKSFKGVGLRPYAPTHLRVTPLDVGGIKFSWVRRTRIDGDSWLGSDVPLGEDSEAYLVRIRKNGTPVREAVLPNQEFVYSATDMQADEIEYPIEFEVAQVSAHYGPGPFERITLNG